VGTRRAPPRSSTTAATGRSKSARSGGGRPDVLHQGRRLGDYDGDGYPDLYVSNFGGENFLYHNQGDGTFREVAREMGVEKPIMSFPTWFWTTTTTPARPVLASFMPSVTEVARRFLALPPRPRP